MIIRWINNQDLKVTNELVNKTLIDYLLESLTREGPQYGVSGLPNWLEDLSEDNPVDYEKIQDIFNTELKLIKNTELNDLKEHIRLKKMKFQGRDVTFNGLSEITEPITVKIGDDELTLKEFIRYRKEQYKSDQNKPEEPEEPEEGVEYRQGIEPYTDEESKKLVSEAKLVMEKELEEEKSEDSPNLDLTTSRVDAKKRDGSWVLQIQRYYELDGTIGDLESQEKLDDFIGFDYSSDALETEGIVEEKNKQVKQIRDLFKGKMPIDLYALDDKLTIKSRVSDKDTSVVQPIDYTWRFTGDSEVNKKTFEKIGKKFGRLVELSKDNLIDDMTFGTPKRLLTSFSMENIPSEEMGDIIHGQAKAQEWFKDEFKPDIRQKLEGVGALDIRFVNDIIVTGIITPTFNKDDSDYNIKVSFRYAIDTKKGFEFKESRNIPKLAITESKIGRPELSGQAAKTIHGAIKFQYAPIEYNPLRSKFANHVLARLSRLEEAGVK